MTHAQIEQSTNKKQNLARFFLEQRHIAWVSLAVALLWGIYGLLKMPQRKDPDIPVRQAMIIVPWQGTSSEQVEQLVTRKIEQANDRHFRDAWAGSRPLFLRRAGSEIGPLGTRRAAWFCCSGETLSEASNNRDTWVTL